MQRSIVAAALLVLAPLTVLQAQAAWQLEETKPLPSRAPAVTHRLVTVRGEGATLELHLVAFDRRRCRLRVLELPPGGTVAGTLREHGALAGVNGGYFKPGGIPLGLVVSGGQTVHPLETAKILSGVLTVTPRGSALLRTAEFKLRRGVRDALQAGPFLVDHGGAVAGLNDTQRAERTVLLADKEGVAALLTTAPVTLAELGKILATPGVLPGLKIERALNLDGGSSTALWVAADPAPFSRSEWKPVRNAVAVVPISEP